jgi:deoxyribodipyrimidine photo-lyase
MAEITQQRVGCVLGSDYPLPIVEPAAAAREARERIWALRQELGFREIAQSIHKQHGSRLSNQATQSRKRRSRPSPGSSGVQQLDLGLG